MFAGYYHCVNWLKDLVLDISGGLTGTQYDQNWAKEKKCEHLLQLERQKHCQVEFYCSCPNMNVEKGK